MNQHLFFKYMEFVLTRNNVCKGNIAGRERGCRQSLYRGKKTSDNTGGTRTRDFSLQHKTFSALNYARDFGTTVKESLKRTRNSKWVTLTKSRIVPCQILSCLCQQSQLSLPSVQTVTREDEGLDRELLTCLTRISMGWWLLRLSAKILAHLRLSVNFFQLRLTKKLKINFFVSKS